MAAAAGGAHSRQPGPTCQRSTDLERSSMAERADGGRGCGQAAEVKSRVDAKPGEVRNDILASHP
eukprot:8699193-Alexandrium_andersonii.AAC.1